MELEKIPEVIVAVVVGMVVIVIIIEIILSAVKEKPSLWLYLSLVTIGVIAAIIFGIYTYFRKPEPPTPSGEKFIIRGTIEREREVE